MVLRNTLAVVKDEAQVDLSGCMPLIRCKAVQSQGLSIVPRNAAITIVVAHSYHKLPKAAACRSALPSERKPSRSIMSNTIAPIVAESEYSLAVRAAQRRAGRSQLKRSLLVHGQSAVNQHIRQVRVRGPCCCSDLK